MRIRLSAAQHARAVADGRDLRLSGCDGGQDPKYSEADVEYIREDMSVMSDMELNELVQGSRALKDKFALPPELLMDSAKFTYLREELPRLRAEVPGATGSSESGEGISHPYMSRPLCTLGGGPGPPGADLFAVCGRAGLAGGAHGRAGPALHTAGRLHPRRRAVRARSTASATSSPI